MAIARMSDVVTVSFVQESKSFSKENETLKFKEIKRKDGAGNGIRTRDFNLGKVALYH